MPPENDGKIMGMVTPRFQVDETLFTPPCEQKCMAFYEGLLREPSGL
jgi:hypothetical protein